MQPDSQSLQDKIKALIIEHLNLDIAAESFPETENFLEKYGLNSVDALELLLKIENEFDMEIDDEDLNADLLKSVQTLSAYVDSKLKE